MSRIGKKPIEVPSGVEANVSGQTVKVKGSKGQLEVTIVTVSYTHLTLPTKA